MDKDLRADPADPRYALAVTAAAVAFGVAALWWEWALVGLVIALPTAIYHAAPLLIDRLPERARRPAGAAAAILTPVLLALYLVPGADPSAFAALWSLWGLVLLIVAGYAGYGLGRTVVATHAHAYRWYLIAAVAVFFMLLAGAELAGTGRGDLLERYVAYMIVLYATMFAAARYETGRG